MPRDWWQTAEGKAEAAAEGAKGNAVIQRKRDHRKSDAIALYDDGKGLDANQIAKKLKCSRRTVNRYLKMTLTNSIE